MMGKNSTLLRCGWVSEDDLYQQYHDEVWGRPELDSQSLFAKLCLEGQQAGLSWITILRKQKNYESAFFNFDPEKIARMTEDDIALRLQDTGLVRHKLKLNGIVKNAKAFLAIEETGSFCEFIWQFTNGKVIENGLMSYKDGPTSTPISKQMSKTLKRHGFTFVGETICYAFMQAAGLVNDHEVSCHCYEEVRKLAL